MGDELELQIHGDASLPTLIYLPGLHGDWTLIGGFRRCVAGKVRFVEVTYPRTLSWSLDDYAIAIESALARRSINCGWLLAESFGSQPLWTLVARNPGPHLKECAPTQFCVEGIILAGGFVRHPLQWVVHLTELMTGAISNAIFVWIVFNYAKVARLRYRRSPEVLATIDEFIARRSQRLDRRAARNRVHLIANNDPRQTAARTTVPIFGLSGWLDPVVPWPWVRRWLTRHCPTLKAFRVLREADHNVLSTAPQAAAAQVLQWMQTRA